MPKDLDDKASRLTKKEGIPDSAIIRKAVARYGHGQEQPTAAAPGREGTPGTHE